MTAPTPHHQLPEFAPLQAMLRGTVTALVVVIPAAVLNQIVVEGQEPDSTVPPVVFLFWALILLGGAAGGWATVRLSPAAPLPYPAGAAALAYVLVQAVGVVLRVLDGDSIGWIAYPFLALFMATCGMLGGLFARRWLKN